MKEVFTLSLIGSHPELVNTSCLAWHFKSSLTSNWPQGFLGHLRLLKLFWSLSKVPTHQHVATCFHHVFQGGNLYVRGTCMTCQWLSPTFVWFPLFTFQATACNLYPLFLFRVHVRHRHWLYVLVVGSFMYCPLQPYISATIKWQGSTLVYTISNERWSHWHPPRVLITTPKERIWDNCTNVSVQVIKGVYFLFLFGL